MERAWSGRERPQAEFPITYPEVKRSRMSGSEARFLKGGMERIKLWPLPFLPPPVFWAGTGGKVRGGTFSSLILTGAEYLRA